MLLIWLRLDRETPGGFDSGAKSLVGMADRVLEVARDIRPSHTLDERVIDAIERHRNDFKKRLENSPRQRGLSDDAIVIHGKLRPAARGALSPA